MESDRPTLAIVPTFIRDEKGLDLVTRCLVSLWTTAPGTPTLVIDDLSPAQHLVDQLEAVVDELGFALVRKDENEGFARTVNLGLEQAEQYGWDAVLVNADVEFTHEHWLERMRSRLDTQGRPAAVVGARLLFPNGLIQHAGIYFSLLTRSWEHRLAMAPEDLPEASDAVCCPVTGALQLIRLETLRDVGLYDSEFRMGYEDVDYCLRVFEAGLECVYDGSATAVHHESMFRGGDEELRKASWDGHNRLRAKHHLANFSPWVPEVR